MPSLAEKMAELQEAAQSQPATHVEFVRQDKALVTIDALADLIPRLVVAAHAFEHNLSPDCDGPERDALRQILSEIDKRIGS